MWNFGVLDVKLSTTILGFHVFIGCDQSVQFSAKTKVNWWKAFKAGYAEILEEFLSLEASITLPDDITVKNMDCFGSHI